MRSQLLLGLAATCCLVASTASAASSCVSPGGGGGCFATIQAAVDASAAGDTIDVAAGVYAENVTIGAGRRLTIHGAGVGLTVLDTGPGVDGFAITGPGTEIAISGLTIQNASGYGVLILQRAHVTLATVEIVGTTGDGIFEGGAGCRLAVDSSTVHDNAGYGILVYPHSRLLLTSSTVSGSKYGGVTGFSAPVPGGLMAPFVAIEDSTISGNGTAGLSGYDWGIRGGRLRIVRSTVTENAGHGLQGPILFGPRPKIGSTILSNNGVDCDERIRSIGYNFVGTACSANLFGTGVPLDVVGDDPMLGPLQDNGGPTPTQMPSPGSPVLEVVNRGCVELDQRGVSRLPPPCDVGAVEAP